MTSSGISHRDLELAEIVEAFEDARRGDSGVTVDDWLQRHPAYADELKDLLPGLLLMEDAASAADASGGQAPRHEPAPERIGEYRILTQLGRGGMGVVYLAIHEPLQREVALKVLPTNLELGEAFLERFHREARVAAGLDHPNIVPVYAVGESEGRHFFAMRFIDGCSLDEVLRAMRGATDQDASSTASGRGSGDMASAVSAVRSMASAEPLPDPRRQAPPAISKGVSPRSAGEIALCLTEALAHAHGHGVLHRDIKPGNVLIDKEGRPFIADFGLCRVEEGGDLTGTQSVVGTLRYMAPEQVEGASDERSDVYSLGLVLFEMLTLRPAFDATRRTKLIHDILHQSVPKVSRFRKRVPRPLEVIVRKATAKLPEERYVSAQAMARDLSAFLEGRPIEATPPSSYYLAKLFVLRHRLASATALIAFIALGLLGARYVSDLRASQRVAQRQAYIGDLAAAEAALREGSIVRAKSHLAAAPGNFRSWEWDHLMARADQSTGRVLLQKGWLRFASVSPSGEYVAVSGERGLSIVRLPSLEVTSQFTLGSTGGTAWNSAGDQLAVALEARAVLLYDVDGDGVAVEALRDERPEARESGVVCMARVGGRFLFAGDYQFGGNQGRVRSWAPHQGKISEVSQLGARVIALGALGEAGSFFSISEEVRKAAATPGSDAWWAVTELGALTVHAGGRTERLDLRLPGEAVSDCCRVGDDLVIGTRQGGIVRYSLTHGGAPERLASSGAKVLAVAATSDFILAAGEDRSIRAFDRRDPSKPFQFSGSAHAVTNLQWLPDGRRFLSLSSEGQLRLWDLDAMGGGQTLRGHMSDVGKVAFAPDGRRLVTGGRAGLVFVWDALRGERLARLEGIGDLVAVALFLGPGDQVLGIGKQGRAFVWDHMTGEVLVTRDLKGAPFSHGVWDPVRGAAALLTSTGLRYIGRDLEWLDSEPEMPKGDASSRLRSLTWDQASKSLLALSADGSITVTDSSGRSRVIIPALEALPSFIGGLSTGTQGTRFEGLAFYGLQDGTLAVVQIESGELLCMLGNEGGENDPGEFLMGATTSPDGERLLVTTMSGLVGVWTIEGEHLLDLRGHGDWGLRMVTSPSIGVSVSASSEGSVRLWNTRSSKDISDMRLATEPLASSEWIARLQRQSSVESVLDQITESVIETPGRLASHEWLLLSGILRWQPENRRAPALFAMLRAATRTEASWIPKLEQAISDLPVDHFLQSHLAEALTELRGRLLKRAAGR